MPDTTRRTSASGGLAELIYADPAWLRAEFDAIVAASFPSPIPGHGVPSPTGRAGPPVESAPRRDATDPALPLGAIPPAEQQGRERSPPGPSLVPQR